MVTILEQRGWINENKWNQLKDMLIQVRASVLSQLLFLKWCNMLCY